MPVASLWYFSRDTLASAKPCFSIASALASIPFASAIAFLLQHGGFGRSFFLQAGRLWLPGRSLRPDLWRSRFGRFGFGQHLGCRGFLLGRVSFGFGFDADLFGQQFARFLFGLGELCLPDQFLFGLHFGRGDLDFLESFGRGEFFGVLDPFLLFDHGPFDGDSFANHFLDISLLDFDRLFLFDIGDADDTQAFGHFQVAVAIDSLQFDGIGLFLVSLGDQNLARLVFFGDAKLFFGRDSGTFGFEPLLLLDLLGRGRFPRRNFGDLALLLFDRFDSLPLQGEDRLFRLDVLFLERLFFVARELVLLDLFVRRQLGDLLDPLGVQNVGRAEHLQRRLFQIVDRRIIESISVQVGSDDLQDFAP